MFYCNIYLKLSFLADSIADNKLLASKINSFCEIAKFFPRTVLNTSTLIQLNSVNSHYSLHDYLHYSFKNEKGFLIIVNLSVKSTSIIKGFEHQDILNRLQFLS